jgi:hypothetical protein
MTRLAARLCFGLALAFTLGGAAAAAAAGASWLDQTKIVPWNMPGNPIPTAKSDPALAEGFQRCSASIRHETFPEDRAVRFAGWRLVGPYKLFNGTALVGGAIGFDGMCRPIGYQEFVFAGGGFAGTIAPAAVDSRVDGSISNTTLYSANEIVTTFARYKAADPLCCPSATTIVTYKIDQTSPRGPVMNATSVLTN